MAASFGPASFSIDYDEVDRILQNIVSERQRLGNNEGNARETLIEQAQSLITALRNPVENILWMIWAEPTRGVAGRIGLDLKVYETLVSEDGRPKSDVELAAPTGASAALVTRLTRKLASMQMIKEVGPGLYVPNDVTRALTVPKYYEGLRFCFDMAGATFQGLPEYLRKTKYEDPEDMNDGPIQFGLKTPGFWAYMKEHPDMMRSFQAYVHGQREDRPSWLEPDFYPVQARLIEGIKTSSTDAAALVDVGGGVGHTLEEFRVKVPQWPGRLVLQEQDFVIQQARTAGTHPKIELMTHDFFTEQPIKGARAYYMRYILHDWTDDRCRSILLRLKDVMVPGYSKILLNEVVMADQNVSWQHSSFDIFMMALFSTRERSEAQWRALIASVDMKITGIWHKGRGNESLIEIMI